MESLNRLIPLEAIYSTFKGTTFNFHDYLEYRYANDTDNISKEGYYIFLIIRDFSNQFSDLEVSEWYKKINPNLYYLFDILDDKELTKRDKERLSHLLLCNSSTNLDDLPIVIVKCLPLLNGEYRDDNWKVLWNYYLAKLPQLGWPDHSYGKPNMSEKQYERLMDSLICVFNFLPSIQQEKIVFEYRKIENDKPYQRPQSFYMLCLQLRLLQEMNVSPAKAKKLIIHCLQYKSLWEDCFESAYYFNKKQHSFRESEKKELLITFKETEAYKLLRPDQKQNVDREVSKIISFKDNLTFPVIVSDDGIPYLLLLSRSIISSPVNIRKAVNEELQKMDLEGKISLVIRGKDYFYTRFFEVCYESFVDNLLISLDSEHYNFLVSSLIDRNDWEMVKQVLCNKEKIKFISSEVIKKIINLCDDSEIYQLLIGFNAKVLAGCEHRLLGILKQQHSQISFTTELVVLINSPLYDIARFMVKNHFDLVKEDTELFNASLITLARLSVKPWDKDIEQCFDYLIDEKGNCNEAACFCYLQKPYYHNMNYYNYFIKHRSRLQQLTCFSNEWIGIFLTELMICDLNSKKGIKLSYILPYLAEEDIESLLSYIIEKKKNKTEWFLDNYLGPKADFIFSGSLLRTLMSIDLSNMDYLRKKRDILVYNCIKKTKEPDIKQCIEYLSSDDFDKIDLKKVLDLILELSRKLQYWRIAENKKMKLISRLKKKFQKEPKLLNDISLVIKRLKEARTL